MALDRDSWLTWGALTFRGDPARGDRFSLSTLAGWEGLPASRESFTSRARSHGSFDEPVWSDKRRVIATGRCRSAAERDEMLVELGAGMAFGATGDLTVRLAGRTLTARARLTRYEPVMDAWGSGLFGWKAEWVCPDPLRYADVVSATTGFPERTGGLRWPMFSDGAGNNVGATDWGPIGTTGRAVVTNTGTADSWPQFQIEGPTPVQGFEIIRVGSGTRTVFTGPVSATSQLVIDQATGLALMGGKADRTLAIFEPEPVRPGETAEYAFVNRGARTDAQLTVSIRPAFW